MELMKQEMKEEIVRLTWERKGFSCHGNEINIDHDYASGVLMQRKKYTEAKQVLKEKGIHFRLLTPSELTLKRE